MPDAPDFSVWLLEQDVAKNGAALARIALGKRRIQSVLDLHRVAHRRTLEKKICDQGPSGQRVDPHLLGYAIDDLIELNRLAVHQHPADPGTDWYANILTPPETFATKLDLLAPLHRTVTAPSFGNLLGDALEVVVFKALAQTHATFPRYSFAGHFDLNAPKNLFGRYTKTQPPRQLQGHATQKEADFLQFGHDGGTMCIECKNFREWFYPHNPRFKNLIIKAADLAAIPVMIARRMHYTTIRNFLAPAGIIAHEAYHQYYPADQAEIAASVRDKNLLGFSDVEPVEEPRPRTLRFFTEMLPNVSVVMAERWNANKTALLEYANDEINLAQLYNAIGSPAAGNWQDAEEEEPPPDYY